VPLTFLTLIGAGDDAAVEGITEGASQLSVADPGTKAAATEDAMAEPTSGPGPASAAAVPVAEPEQRMSFYEGTIISVQHASVLGSPSLAEPSPSILVSADSAEKQFHAPCGYMFVAVRVTSSQFKVVALAHTFSS